MNPEMLSVKEVVKTGANYAMGVLLSPLIAACKIQMRLTSDECFKNYGMLLATLPGLLGREVRRAFYGSTLRRCGRSLQVGFGSYFVSPKTDIGDNVFCGSYCVIGPCSIGSDVMMASHISIIDGVHQHGTSDLFTTMVDQPGQSEHVVIGDHCWIGEGARVAASVGTKSIVGVGSVVTRPLKDAVIVLGNPARVIGQRTDPLAKQRTSASATPPAEVRNG